MKQYSKKKKAKTYYPKQVIWLYPVIILLILSTLTIVYFFNRSNKPVFNGEKAFLELVKQTEFGPRISGSDSHRRAQEYLVSKLKSYADLVSEQRFVFKDKHDSTKIYEGINIVASFNISKDVKKRILLAAHWDSRPFADNDPIKANRQSPVTGANDGASGVAVLLELARLFSKEKPNIGVDIVLFDLEDIGDVAEPSNNELNRNPFSIGSEMFVNNNPEYMPQYGILVDMIGDKELRIPKEAYSNSRAGEIVEKVWTAAKRVGSNAFSNETGIAVMDDHIPFLKRNIPVIDLIHTPFPKSWHTTSNKPENCSTESLKQVGNVLVEVVYEEK